ncbi:DNA-primase RepB domain-containing protein [Nitrosomonas ureae]|uniref:RepB-like DNA primase domain-containing protein n=1 Tax=Nitrosomonas ureae TaxID=44577 RepID=A0A1H9GTS8_9PROT|nr:DNA-primase RepB domain-containing protein [Nitrosomonas ureae]SEQ53477.1 Protein of unknown function [Nitrosomonas ureae]
MITNENAPDAGRHEASSFDAFYRAKYIQDQAIRQADSILDSLGEKHTFQTFGDKNKGNSLVKIMHGTLEEWRPKLEELNRQGAGIFFTVNKTDGQGRAASNVVRVCALVADFDTQDFNRTFDNLPLVPSIVIESSPGKHHAYWIIEDILPLNEFKPCQKALATMLGSDPKICDLPRVMRVPRFLHQKGQPFMVREVFNSGKRYTAKELKDWIGVGNLARTPNKSAPVVTIPNVQDDFYAVIDFDNLLFKLQSAVEGNRNDTLNKVAYRAYGFVKAGRLDKDHVTSKLEDAASRIGLEPSEVTATLRSAWKGAPVINDLPSLPEFNEQPVTEEEAISCLQYPPGLVGEIAKYIIQSSRMPVKSFAIAGALTTISYLNSNKAYVGGSDTALNLYICLVGDTGRGKEDPRKAIKRLIDSVRNVSRGESIHESIASGAALLRSLEGNPSTFILIDEFGIYLQTALSERGSIHQKDLIKDLMTLYGLGRSFFAGKAYADKKQNIGQIDNPYINLIGTTTPLELLDGITPRMIDNGLLNRIIFVQADKENPINRKPDTWISDELKHKMAAIRAIDTSVIDYEEGAHDLLIQFAEQLNEKDQFANLWSRAEEQTIRVAGLLAIGDGGVIKREHITWAWSYVNGSIKAFAQKLEKDLAENPFQKQAAKALDFIKNAINYSHDRQFGGYCRRGLMPRGKLTKLLKMKSREVDEVIIYLVETRQISHCDDGGTKCFSVL